MGPCMRGRSGESGGRDSGLCRRGGRRLSEDGGAGEKEGGDDDSDEDADSPFAQLGHWIEENRDEANAVVVYKKAEELGIAKKHNALTVIGQTLFTENVVAEIEKYAPLFAKVRGTSHRSAL